MPLFRTKLWTPWDIALLKWSALLLGVVIGVWADEWIRPYAGWILLVSGLLAIRPAVAYFRPPSSGPPQTHSPNSP